MSASTMNLGKGFSSRVTPQNTRDIQTASSPHPSQQPPSQSSFFGSAQSRGYSSIQNPPITVEAFYAEAEKEAGAFPHKKLLLSAAGARVVALTAICVLMATQFDEENVHPYAMAAGILLAVAAPCAGYSLVRGAIFPWFENVESSNEVFAQGIRSMRFERQADSWNALFFYITAALATTSHVFIPKDILASSPYPWIVGGTALVMPFLIAHFSALVKSLRGPQEADVSKGKVCGVAIAELVHLSYAACVFSYEHFFAANDSDVSRALSISVIVYSAIDLFSRLFRMCCS